MGSLGRWDEAAEAMSMLEEQMPHLTLTQQTADWYEANRPR